MKTVLILTTLLSLALASPLNPRQGVGYPEPPEHACDCNYMCTNEAGELNCVCLILSLNECYRVQQINQFPCLPPTFPAECNNTALPSPPKSVRQTPSPANEGENCGGILGTSCTDGLICVSNDPDCRDCEGLCESNLCGGILGENCPRHYECVLDEVCLNQGGGSDCTGVCELSLFGGK
ncbi:uncharacterized protein BDR25DRAFT_11805 [Lindgomyces ingoldianus]|uniref:Uncharacterized protein n=1 Tax=Lindgomyces ingoldianus TaxID=673940 RepID=A0ACB6R106_9PLEO|nr:uncharacterized protein BDR25DRAFT_11805 [Lindgomyces ingoldianus]KAF2472826.1 hypothetical protein BDR25DRAFT_11805 [Lindgomyces ingoldianus]